MHESVQVYSAKNQPTLLDICKGGKSPLRVAPRACVHAHVYACAGIYMNLREFACVCVCASVCVCVCARVRV